MMKTCVMTSHVHHIERGSGIYDCLVSCVSNFWNVSNMSDTVRNVCTFSFQMFLLAYITNVSTRKAYFANKLTTSCIICIKQCLLKRLFKFHFCIGNFCMIPNMSDTVRDMRLLFPNIVTLLVYITYKCVYWEGPNR